MYFSSAIASLASLASFVGLVSADLRITADHHSFGGVNYPTLQFLEPNYRDEVIRAIVKTNARVIRLFIQGDGNHGDPEPSLGEFDRSMLDQFDDTLAAIHRISKGQVKVIISPHNAHALRGTNDVPCDAYCEKLDGAFLDFYSNLEIRETYKTRLEVFFRHYPSKNFDGASWSTLNQVILGVDIQNEPWSGIWPIVAGEGWLCDIATHLKEDLGLGENNIAIITGGISGAQKVDGIQNFPDSAFECKAVDVIGIHGYFGPGEDSTAGTPWANIFLPGNTLTSRALDKKLLLVEEWAYVHTEQGMAYKQSAIWDQGNALNYRGIPWIYSYATHNDEGPTARVNVLRDSRAAIGALSDLLRRAYRTRSNFDWSKYLLAPPRGLSNATTVALNPFVPEQSDCTFGCLGYLCDAADGCAPDLLCKNSVCQMPEETQPGNVGAECNSKKVCQEHLRCDDGICQQCEARASIQPKVTRKPTIKGREPEEKPRPIATNSIKGSCEVDLQDPFHCPKRNICAVPAPLGSPLRRGNPCESARHCDANEYCDWGLCKLCTEGCLGMKCRSNNKCKTGFCNEYGRCDYIGKKKPAMGPGGRASSRNRRGPGWNAGPKNQGSGPNKVRDEAMRINIPKEKVQATGNPTS